MFKEPIVKYVFFLKKTCNEEHNREERNTPTTTHTYTSEGPHMHQQL
jgi:hypothetical protein